MITVEHAEKIIQSVIREAGTELISLEVSLGRVLAEDIFADRDLPPFNRVTMDGIAVCFESITKSKNIFAVHATQAAGDQPVILNDHSQCIEIMTGAALPYGTDTVIPYENVQIENGEARILNTATGIKKGQNVHYQGSDKKSGEILISSNQIISPQIKSIAGSVGKSQLKVKKAPPIVVISSGDEIVELSATPGPYQLRSSNSTLISSTLEQMKVPSTLMHVADNEIIINSVLEKCLQEYEVIIVTGGVSMGKFDFIPLALEKLQVKKLFHHVKQKPGKPFWFGIHENGASIFAFPGNPVSVCICLHKYFMPWLKQSLGLKEEFMYVTLDKDLVIKSTLKTFTQVKLINRDSQLFAMPVQHNSSGDFSSIAFSDGFIELPEDHELFREGEVFRYYPW